MDFSIQKVVAGLELDQPRPAPGNNSRSLYERRAKADERKDEAESKFQARAPYLKGSRDYYSLSRAGTGTRSNSRPVATGRNQSARQSNHKTSLISGGGFGHPQDTSSPIKPNKKNFDYSSHISGIKLPGNSTGRKSATPEVNPNYQSIYGNRELRERGFSDLYFTAV